MNKLARALALCSGLMLLAGCDTISQWLPIAADHRPEVTVMQVTGFVVDAAGADLPGALVSNGASVAFTAEDGSFTLKNVRTGVQYVTATYDNVKSEPFQIEVRGDQANVITKIVVGVARPVGEGVAAVTFIQALPDTLIATYSSEIASGSTDTTYGASAYGTTATGGTGRDVILSVASPPNGMGTTIRSYSVVYEGSAVATFSADFSPVVSVFPGTLTESGPLKNITVKNVGPTSALFSQALASASAGIVTAKISLFTEPLASQPVESTVTMHLPEKGQPDKSVPFVATITLQKAEE